MTRESLLYDQIRINPADVATLRLLFGSSNVFDFSGPNNGMPISTTTTRPRTIARMWRRRYFVE